LGPSIASEHVDAGLTGRPIGRYNVTVIAAEWFEEAEMRRMSRLSAGVVVAVVVSALASSAFAQGTRGTEGGSGRDQGYGYEFSDDPLSAGGFGPNDATIRVRPGPVRTTLIRPRTSFVPEMLKSVENL
jgi:hypothetical protein